MLTSYRLFFVRNRYTGVDTLDEPVTTTMARDLLSIYSKIVQVLYPRRSGDAREVLRCAGLPFYTRKHTNILHREWDLWGPLLLCLGLGVMLSLNVCYSARVQVRSGVY